MWYNELAALIEEQKWEHGAALGINNGSMLVACFEKAPELRMLGMDLWAENLDEDGVSKDEKQCRKSCEPYGQRVLLLKGDAAIIAKGFRVNTFDFAVYNCFDSDNNTSEYHKKILDVWITKIKSGGYIVGKDMNDEEVQKALTDIGLGEATPVIVNGKESETLKYVILN